ncbi:hypothetical protein HA402_002094 [Bradysia odoriphaga]|nr:hypothetical protein HA402_002094 [Bradysia odoriphaga]
MSFNTILIVTLMTLQLIANGQTQTKFTGFCEFDLVDELIAFNPNILDSLPSECKTFNANSDVRLAMKEESNKFEEFMGALADKENWKEQGNDESKTTLDLDFELRTRLYTSPDNSTFGNCTATTDTTNDYVDCIIKFRQNMINKINELE